MACEHILLHVPQSVLVDKPSSEYLDSGAVSSSLRMARQSRNFVVFPYARLTPRAKGAKNKHIRRWHGGIGCARENA